MRQIVVIGHGSSNSRAIRNAIRSVKEFSENRASERIERGLAAGLERAASLGSVGEVRVLGAVGVVQLREPVRVGAVTAAALDRGVWVRPFRDLVYTMPPYVSTDDDVAAIGRAVTAAVTAQAGA